MEIRNAAASRKHRCCSWGSSLWHAGSRTMTHGSRPHRTRKARAQSSTHTRLCSKPHYATPNSLWSTLTDALCTLYKSFMSRHSCSTPMPPPHAHLPPPPLHPLHSPQLHPNPYICPSPCRRSPLCLLHHLRRHPAGRPHKGGARHLVITPGPAALNRCRHPKVPNLDAAIAVDQDIAGLRGHARAGQHARRRSGIIARAAAVCWEAVPWKTRPMRISSMQGQAVLVLTANLQAAHALLLVPSKSVQPSRCYCCCCMLHLSQPIKAIGTMQSLTNQAAHCCCPLQTLLATLCARIAAPARIGQLHTALPSCLPTRCKPAGAQAEQLHAAP